MNGERVGTTPYRGMVDKETIGYVAVRKGGQTSPFEKMSTKVAGIFWLNFVTTLIGAAVDYGTGAMREYEQTNYFLKAKDSPTSDPMRSKAFDFQLLVLRRHGQLKGGLEELRKFENSRGMGNAKRPPSPALDAVSSAFSKDHTAEIRKLAEPSGGDPVVFANAVLGRYASDLK